MRTQHRLGLLLFAVVVAGCAPQGSSAAAQDTQRSEAVELDVPTGRMIGRAYFSEDRHEKPVLAIVLHGDLLRPVGLGTSSYHYRFAETIASRASNAVVVGLIRPGYEDERGSRSEGDALLATGDNYTPEVVEAIAQAAEQLAAHYDARSTVLIGHSGGAAISALVLGRHPEAADAALLVACPCDLPAWRAHMMNVQDNNPVWLQPHRGLSPIDFATAVTPQTDVELVVGADDQVALPEYSEAYATVLAAQGNDVRVSVLPDLEHNILLEQPVISTAIDLVERMSPSTSE